MIQSSEKLFEGHIKSLVLDNLLVKFGSKREDVVFINEFTLDNYSRRIDIAMIHNGYIYGYEIKSEFDSLTRLSGQILKYLEFFDKVIVVVSSKHIDKVLNNISPQVEVWVVDKNGKLAVKKRGVKSRPNGFDFLNILRKTELFKLANILNVDTTSRSKEEIKTDIKKISLNAVRREAINLIRKRFEESSNRFLSSVDKKTRVDVEDVALLSPYAIERSIMEKSRQEKKKAIDGLIKKEKDDLLLYDLAREQDDPLFGLVPNNIKNLLDY